MNAHNKKLATIFFLLLLPGSVIAWGMYGFFEPRTLYPTGLEPLDVSVGDINADGHNDLITANREGFSLSVFMGNGDGTLTEVNAIESEFGFTSITLADVNGDSMLDAVATTCNSDVHRKWYRNISWKR